MTQKIRLHLSAYDAKVLDTAADLLASVARSQNTRVYGPTPLPVETSSLRLFDNAVPILYELRLHKRIVDLLDPSPHLIDTLVRLNLPNGVSVEIKS